MTSAVDAGTTRGGSVGEVFLAFLKLGLTSFGGPIAHLGYFRDELVLRRRWIDESGYADLVALCQFLPGPASSQVGFALGLMRAGAFGALAAWSAFTLPSAILMVAFAYGAELLAGPAGATLIHGLKLVAVAIVAQAVLGMARALTPDARRAGIAVAALAIVTLGGGGLAQLGAIAFGASAGLLLCRAETVAVPAHAGFAGSRRCAVVCLVLFLLLLFGLPVLRLTTGLQAAALVDAFYRSGALVFGGGHVVLPLLQTEIVPPGWMSSDTFLAGYGAAQAIPGPLFTFAAYLGAAMGPAPHGVPGAALALVSIFLPGFLILLAALPFWSVLRAKPVAQAALRGSNAAVVGLLGAALYDPVWTSGVQNPRDLLIVATGFVALGLWKAPPWVVVVGIVTGTFVLAAF
jgi:chromate transporter